MDTLNSREEEAKKLPPECQASREECKQQTVPAREDIHMPGWNGECTLPKLAPYVGHHAKES